MAAFVSRYAQALADVVLLDAHLDPALVDGQLADFAAAWHESADLREIFLDPSFPIDQKVSILDKLNTRLGMAQPVRNFLAVLINHDRMQSFDEVLAAFRHQMNQRLGISEVEVTTARPLGQDERSELEAQVAGWIKTRVAASFSEDPSLVGGVIVRIGSTVYDGSVRGRLTQLRETLEAS
jgi:F-type H+-transporting ATPase subunit delta